MWLTTGEQRTGVGDGELRLKGRIYEHGGYILVQAGVIQTLPIGSRTERLGNGSTVLTPFVTGGYKIGNTIIYGYVSDAVAIRRDNQKRYEDLTDPSRDHETRCAIGFIHLFSDVVQMNFSLSAITIMTKQDFGQTFLHGGPLVAFAPADTVHIALGAQVPIAGEKRFDWRGTLDAYLSF